MAGGGKGLDLSGVRNVRSAAQINQVAALVDGGTSTVCDLGLQNFHLERIIGKQFQTFFLSNNQTLKLLLGLDNFADLGFNRRV